MTSAKSGEFYCYGRLVSAPQSSIHPRVYLGRTIHPKVNTSKSPNPATLDRLKAALALRMEAHPRDAMTAARLASLAA